MAEKNMKVGARIEVTGKKLFGTVTYVGMTSFAVGKWVGIVLDEPKGKNNGTIKGQTYFECEENYGMFVRPSQLRIIGSPLSISTLDKVSSSEDIGETGSLYPCQPTRARLSGSRSSLSSSRQSLLSTRSQFATSTERSASTVSVPSTGRRSIQTAAKDILQTMADNSGNNNNNTSSSSSKRASFVETGFLEILKPQFTASQPMRSPSFTATGAVTTTTTPTTTPTTTNADRTANAEQHKLIEDMRAQIFDLTEKLETIKQRRAEDKERLREFDKMQIQFEQMQEFRTKIMASQATLQKELQRAKQEAKDAVEAKERHAQEMCELSDNVELITLDKEMAEEKADTLQLELDTAKERIEELQVDLELLRSEMQNKTESRISEVNDGAVSVNASSFEFKQLEQQNLRLKDTLVRLRDLSAHDKHDIQKLCKELEMKKSEVHELEHTKEKLSAIIDELEATVADLQEQVDAALGAEEMVEQLAEKKMELDDKVKALEAEVAQLEALEEVHEQLMESNHELEMDLREELDMANAARKEVLRERDAAIETIYDRDQTIIKFRELVQKLNEQLLDLRDRSTSNEPKSLQDAASLGTVTKLGETIDYKQIFAESKAYTRAIDVQLRQIELMQANEHVEMLTAFMPESFMTRGGDNDAILVILLISRIVFKCGIIVSQTRERFPAVGQVTREAVIQGHSVEQYGFKCRLMHYIHNLQCALHQILFGLNSCQPETLLRAGNSLPEMVAQEKTIDGIIEVLKLNQLDENSSTDNIEKCVSFFNAMNTVLLAGEDILNETQVIRDSMASLSSACDAILNDVAIARVITRESSVPGTSDLLLLLQFVADHAEAMKQQAKLIKRRLPQDQHIIKCGLSLHRVEAMPQHVFAFGRIMAVMHLAIKQALQSIVASIENDNTAEHALEQNKFWNLLTLACERIYEQDDRGPSQNFKNVLSEANNELQQIAQHLLDKEYEIMSFAQQKESDKINTTISPILLRAQHIKKQLEQKNVLAATLENREADIKQLKLAAKMKQNEFSEMQIRKDLAEKKLSVLQHEYEHAVEKMQRQNDETIELLKRKEKEFEDTMDHLQKDIETLEIEKSKLREKLKSIGLSVGLSGALNSSVGGTKRDVSLTMSSGSANTSMVNISTSTAFNVTHTNMVNSSSPILAEEMQFLRNACAQERQSRLRLQAEYLRDKLRKFTPIYVPQPKDKRILSLEQKLIRIKHDWALSLLHADMPGRDISTSHLHTIPINNNTVAMQRRNMQLPQRGELCKRANVVATEILAEYLQRHPHRAAIGQFTHFPTVEVKQVLKI